MKRIVRLTESDLARIVKRVIREQEEETDSVEMEIEDTDENDAKGLERTTLKFYFFYVTNSLQQNLRSS